MDRVVNPDVVADWEDVARMLFSPLFISEGILSQRARNAGKRKSHAGIFATINNKRLKGGMPQTPARMLARMSLVNIAQSNIHKL